MDDLYSWKVRRSKFTLPTCSHHLRSASTVVMTFLRTSKRLSRMGCDHPAFTQADASLSLTLTVTLGSKHFKRPGTMAVLYEGPAITFTVVPFWEYNEYRFFTFCIVSTINRLSLDI